jgi:hypothetical protein
LGFSCTEAIFKENQQQRSWWQKEYTIEELYECPSLPAAKFIQLVSLLKYYIHLKSG